MPKGIIMKRLRYISLILAIAMLPLFISCELDTADTNDIDIWIICSGGTTNDYTFDLILDNKAPLSNISGTKTIILPVGDIEKATISVTKTEPEASLTIAIYNNNEFDDKGYATLDSCTAASTSCSNTLSLQYEALGEETEGTPAASTSEEETTE